MGGAGDREMGGGGDREMGGGGDRETVADAVQEISDGDDPVLLRRLNRDLIPRVSMPYHAHPRIAGQHAL